MWKKNTFDAVKGSDMIVIHTEWNEYRGMDLSKIKKLLKSPVILDLRNIFNKNELNEMGYLYYNIGSKK